MKNSTKIALLVVSLIACTQAQAQYSGRSQTYSYNSSQNWGRSSGINMNGAYNTGYNNRQVMHQGTNRNFGSSPFGSYSNGTAFKVGQQSHNSFGNFQGPFGGSSFNKFSNQGFKQMGGFNHGTNGFGSWNHNHGSTQKFGNFGQQSFFYPN
jgi:hypothetical protein